MPLGRVPASPAIINADNSKLRATISEDRAALIAPSASFMAGEEQTSGSEVNHIIAGIRIKYFRERTGKLKLIQFRYLMACKFVSSFLARTSRYGDTWLK